MKWRLYETLNAYPTTKVLNKSGLITPFSGTQNTLVSRHLYSSGLIDSDGSSSSQAQRPRKPGCACTTYLPRLSLLANVSNGSQAFAYATSLDTTKATMHWETSIPSTRYRRDQCYAIGFDTCNEKAQFVIAHHISGEGPRSLADEKDNTSVGKV